MAKRTGDALRPSDLRRIAKRHSDIPQDGFPELEYLIPESKEEAPDERPDHTD